MHNARQVAGSKVKVPVVVAGNVEAQEEVYAILAKAGCPAYRCANVMPVLNALAVEPAREAIRIGTGGIFAFGAQPSAVLSASLYNGSNPYSLRPKHPALYSGREIHSICRWPSPHHLSGESTTRRKHYVWSRTPCALWRRPPPPTLPRASNGGAQGAPHVNRSFPPVPSVQ